jgi:methyl-accepting chemotaxis protein
MIALADKKGKIIALHSTAAVFPTAVTEEMLRRSLSQGNTSAWWINDRIIYQVVLQRFDDGPPIKSNLQVVVVVGRSMDTRAAGEFSRMSSSQVIFRYGKTVMASSLSALQEQEALGQLQDQPAEEQVYLGGERFFDEFAGPYPGTKPRGKPHHPQIVPRSSSLPAKAQSTASGLGLVAVVAGGTLIYLISDTFTRPLAALLEGVHALEGGNFSHRIEARGGGDELAEVTRAFEGMRSTLQRNEAQREQLEGQLRQSQKMEALGRPQGSGARLQ